MEIRGKDGKNYKRKRSNNKIEKNSLKVGNFPTLQVSLKTAWLGEGVVN
jgi:hypothetical protein